jgi:lipoprotein-releasing system permease protein
MLIKDVDTPPELIGDPFPGLIIGRYVVADRRADGSFRRHYYKGEMVTVTVVRIGINASVDTPIKQPFRYADDTRTGIYEIDNSHCYCDFDLLQQLLEMNQDVFDDGTLGPPARCSQIQIKTAPGTDNKALAARLEARFLSYIDDERFTLDRYDRNLISRINVKTWEESQAHIIGPVEKERVLVTILFGIVSLVAAVLVMCILYMIVLQKTRDIGIIKAIGGSSAELANIFLMYGATVGIVGGILGISAGYYFVIHINDVEAFLKWLNPAWQVWDRSVYSFDEIPNTVRTSEMIAIYIASVIFSTCGAIIAAWRAGVMDPLEALRYE